LIFVDSKCGCTISVQNAWTRKEICKEGEVKKEKNANELKRGEK
jgi:hypothetical protein